MAHCPVKGYALSNRTTIVMPETLQTRAKELGINVSQVCRDALAEAVQAIEVAEHFGDEFETVYAEVDHGEGVRERVQFVGALVFEDEQSATAYYVTSGGQVAAVDSQGLLRWAPDPDLLGLTHGTAHQMLSGALGKRVPPTVLDI